MNWFSRLWQRWFGNPAEPKPGSDLPLSTSAPVTAPRKAPAQIKGDLILHRTQIAAGIYSGKLIWKGEGLCVTLEAASPAAGAVSLLPAGAYPLALFEEGGYHATYAFRFGEQHLGMLGVKPVADGMPRFFRIGETTAESMGHILPGEGLENGILTQPEAAYLRLYQHLAPLIAAGTALTLAIHEA